MYSEEKKREGEKESHFLEYIDTPLCRVHKIAFTFY